MIMLKKYLNFNPRSREGSDFAEAISAEYN